MSTRQELLTQEFKTTQEKALKAIAEEQLRLEKAQEGFVNLMKYGDRSYYEQQKPSC